MSVSKQGKVLIVLLGLLALSLFLNFSPKGQPTFVTVSAFPPQPIRPDTAPDAIPQVGLLRNRPALFSSVKRNVFDFGDSQQPDSTQLDTSSDTSSENEQTTAQSGPTLPDVHYVGLYREKKKPGQLLAAISNGGDISVGAVGDVIENKYRILKIEDDYVIMKVRADGRILRITLGKESGSTEVMEKYP